MPRATILLVSLLSAFALTSSAAVARLPDPEDRGETPVHTPVAGCADAAELAALRLINDYRAEHGLAPLVLSQTLTLAAEYHSASMGTHDYFDHQLVVEGVAWWENIYGHGYPYPDAWLGENIAAGHAEATEAFRQWRESPTHHANMLGANYTAVGIGRTHHPDAQYGWYWTTEFAGIPDAPAERCA